MAKKFLILIALLLATFSFQQTADVITYSNTAYSIDKVRKDAQKILSNIKWNTFLKNSDVWEYRDKGTIWDGYIHLFEFGVKSLSYDLSNSTITIGTEDINILGKGEIQVVFTFNYQAKTSFFSSSQGTGLITVLLNNLFRLALNHLTSLKKK